MTTEQKQDVRGVAADLATHEEVCAERYKQILHRLSRMEHIIAVAAGSVIVGMATVILKLVRLA